MYNKKSIITAIIVFVLILNLRTLLSPEHNDFTFGGIFRSFPNLIYAAGLGYLGSNIRYSVRNPKMKTWRVIAHIFMFIVFVEMIVWTIILLNSNPGLANVFIAVFFLPYGFYFIKREHKDERVPKREIFEKYDKEIDEEDIFEEYLKNQQKDQH